MAARDLRGARRYNRLLGRDFHPLSCDIMATYRVGIPTESYGIVTIVHVSLRILCFTPKFLEVGIRVIVTFQTDVKRLRYRLLISGVTVGTARFPLVNCRRQNGSSRRKWRGKL